MVFQNHKSRSFRVRRGVPQGSVLGPVLFSFFISDLPASLPSSVSCSLYADDLAIWSSSPSVPTAVEATQGALFRLERWSEYWCLPLNPSKCEASRSGPPLSRQGAALAHLDSLPPHDLVLWTDGYVPFHFGKGGSGVPAICFLCGTEATLSFSAGPVCSSFPLKPAPFCTLFAGLGSTNKSAISLLFSYYLTLVLSSPPCSLLHLSSYLKLCGRSGRDCLLSPPVLSDYNGSPDTRFSRGMTRLMSWPDGERYLRQSQSLVVSLLLSLVSTLVLSRTEGVLSHQKFFDTQVLLIFTEELVLPRHARLCPLSSSLQRTQPSFRFLSL